MDSALDTFNDTSDGKLHYFLIHKLKSLYVWNKQQCQKPGGARMYPELFHQVVHSPLVGRICAEIADALEAMRRGEMAPEDFDTLKSERKKQLPIFTPHATFPADVA